MECFGIAAFVSFKSRCPRAKYNESFQEEARWLIQWRMKYGTCIAKRRVRMNSNLPGKPTTTSSFFLDSIPKRHHCLERGLCPLFGGDMSTQLKMIGHPVSRILFEVDGPASHLFNKDFGPGTCWVELRTSRDAYEEMLSGTENPFYADPPDLTEEHNAT
jgi:hypothetical protein